MSKINKLYKNTIVNSISKASFIPSRIRRILLKIYGIKIGKNSYVSPNCFIGGNNISIGNNVFINYECFFDNNGEILIGNNVNIGMRVTFVTSNHKIGDCHRRAEGGRSRNKYWKWMLDRGKCSYPAGSKN